MPYFLDADGAEYLKEAVRLARGTPAGRPASPAEKFARGASARRVYVTGTIQGAFYPAKLQYWDNETETWVDFEDDGGNPIVCWAVPYPGGTLTTNTPYGPGFVVGYDAEEERAVFGVPTGGGSGGSAFSGCRVYRDGANQSIPNSTYTAITFTNEAFDTDNYWSLFSNPSRLTVPQSGKYLLGFQVDQVATGHTGLRVLLVYKNGASLSGLGTDGHQRSAGDENVGEFTNIVTVLSLSAGDYVEAVVFQDSGSDVSARACVGWIYRIDGAGGGGAGTVTSVAMTVPTNMTISGSPITTSGTLALGWSGGNNWPADIDGGTLP